MYLLSKRTRFMSVMSFQFSKEPFAGVEIDSKKSNLTICVTSHNLKI